MRRDQSMKKKVKMGLHLEAKLQSKKGKASQSSHKVAKVEKELLKAKNLKRWPRKRRLSL